MVLHRRVEKVVLQLKTGRIIFFIVVVSNKKEWDGRTLFSAWDFHDSLQEFDLQNCIQEYCAGQMFFKILQVKSNIICYSKKV
jgi:hypothetical protein